MLNLTEATLVSGGGKLELTRNELRILQVLMENKEKVVSRDTLMTKLWESDSYVDENTLSVNVNRLRKRLEIAELLEKYPYEVSGGQKQRTAIARAIITNPQLILADEPTGALDSKASAGLLKVFREINDDGQTILMVTHSLNAASHANRVLFIKDGEVFHQLYRGNLTNEQLYVKISDTLFL